MVRPGYLLVLLAAACSASAARLAPDLHQATAVGDDDHSPWCCDYSNPGECVQSRDATCPTGQPYASEGLCVSSCFKPSDATTAPSSSNHTVLRVYHAVGSVFEIPGPAGEGGQMSLAVSEWDSATGALLSRRNITAPVFAVGNVRLAPEVAPGGSGAGAGGPPPVLLSVKRTMQVSLDVEAMVAPSAGSAASGPLPRIAPLLSEAATQALLAVCAHPPPATQQQPCTDVSTFFPSMGTTGAVAFGFRGWGAFGGATGSQAIAVVDGLGGSAVRAVSYNTSKVATADWQDTCPRFVPGTGDREVVFVRNYPTASALFWADLRQEPPAVRRLELPGPSQMTGCPQFVRGGAAAEGAELVYIGDDTDDQHPALVRARLTTPLAPAPPPPSAATPPRSPRLWLLRRAVAARGVLRQLLERPVLRPTAAGEGAGAGAPPHSYEYMWRVGLVNTPDWAETPEYVACMPVAVPRVSEWQVVCRTAWRDLALVDGPSGRRLTNFTMPAHAGSGWCLTDDCFDVQAL